MQQARAWAAANPGAPNKAPWNGGCTAQQLEWLQQQLADAAAVQEQLIIACHHPVAPGSAPADYLAWDNHKLMDVIAQQPGVVRCVLSGHFHPGGYVQRDGVHYVTFEGVLEAPAASNAYGVVEVHPDRLVILGSGVARCRELLLS
jgi:3',5'-cyclic AMP phosphodiesterase CpdA